jgi:sialate O-acetylesterase
MNCHQTESSSTLIVVTFSFLFDHQTLRVVSSAEDEVYFQDVLFGDVHICGGQSNMQFTLNTNAGVPNLEQEMQIANEYPQIRLFTVGQKINSTVPLLELLSVEQPWTQASYFTVATEPWQAFSAVCWFTFRDVFIGLNGTVPMGLISNNWGMQTHRL